MKHFFSIALLTVAVSATVLQAANRTTVPKIEPAGAEKALARSATERKTVSSRAYMQEPAGTQAAKASVFRTARQSAPTLKATVAKTAAKAPAVAPDNLPDLRGAVYHSDIITGEWDCQYPRGIYSVSSPETTLLLDGPNALYGGVCIENIYYATSYDEYYGTGYTTISAYNLETGKRDGYINGTVECVVTGGVAYDPTTFACYGITFNADKSGMQLTKLIYTTSAVTASKIADLPGNWNSLAINAAGQIYAISYEAEKVDNRLMATSSSLCKIDKNTGDVTVIGETGKAPQYLSSATIDPRSGRMFWNVLEEGKASVLCEVNLSTGAATDLFAYTNNEEIMGMFVPAPEAEDNAPAAVTNLSVSFPKGSMTGSIEFDAPTTTYIGNAADGPLTYSISANGQVVANGNTSFGGHVSTSVTLDTPANYEFIVTLSNDAGISPKAKASLYVGHGVPARPTDVKLVREGTEMKLSWTAVSRAVDEGYIDPAEVKYTVTRNDGSVAAENIAETSFAESVPEPDELTSYSYSVVATNAGLSSSAATSNSLSLGSIKVPYTNTFETAEDMAGFTIIDANKDGKTWSYYTQQKKAMCSYSNEGNVDDWLITPPVKLLAGKIYTLSFTSSCSYANYPERLEVKMGKAATADAMTEQILPATLLTINTPVPFSKYIIPDADGVYFIGFHSISDPKNFNLYLDDIEIKEYVGVPTPSAVTDLKASPDMNGDFSVDIAFTAPTTDFAGNTISQLASIEVKRDGVSVKTLDNPTPGSTYSFTDTPEASGEVTYSVVAANEGGEGESASVTAFVGIGKPLAPTEVNIIETDNDGEVKITWQPVTTDINGKTIKPGLLTYTIATYNVEEQTWQAYIENITDTEFTLRALDEGEQDFVQYCVFAFVGKEYAGTVSPMIPAGTPFSDFAESIPEGYLTYPWSSGFTEGLAQWQMVIDREVEGASSQDGDNGFLKLSGTNVNDRSSLMSGKITLEDCEKPQLSFFAWNIIEAGKPDLNEVNVYIRESRTSEWTLLKNFTISSLGKTEGWVPVIVPLDAYVNKTVEIRLEGVVKTHANMLFDNIHAGNSYTDDLAVRDIQAPETVMAGADFTVDVKIGNNTPVAVGGFDVRLTADGKDAATLHIDAIEPGVTVTASFPQTMSAVATEPVVFSAEVILATDSRTENNKSEQISVAPKHNTYPTVLNLKGQSSSEGFTLSWDAPVLTKGEAVTVTEDFEDFEGFGPDPEGWTTVDRDNKPVGGLYGYPLPGMTAGQDTRSFFVFDTEMANLADNNSFKPHSGKKFFASLYRSDDGEVDDWAISPYLSGKAQTVTLYAKSYQSYLAEHMSVYYSTGSLDTDDFILVEDVRSVPGEWTLYSVDLPEGARYMALRSSATGCYMLMIDDVTYEAGSIHDLLEINGYDIYRGDKKLNDTPVQETSYTIPAAEYTPASSVYSVKVVYNLGESAPQSVSALSSIDEIAGGISVSVNGHTIVVDGADGHHVTVVTIDGKVIVSDDVEGTFAVDVLPAFYIVTVGNHSYKVSVQ